MVSEHGGEGLMAKLGDCRGFFQRLLFYDSVILLILNGFAICVKTSKLFQDKPSLRTYPGDPEVAVCH